MKKITVRLLLLILLSGCGLKENKSVLNQKLHQSPNWFTVTEKDVETLHKSEDDYFILYCSSSDIVCQEILKTTESKVKLSFQSSFYFYDTDQLIQNISKPDLSEQERDDAVIAMQDIMKKYAVTSFPYLQYRQGSVIWGSKAYHFLQFEEGQIPAGDESNIEIQKLCDWINKTNQNERNAN